MSRFGSFQSAIGAAPAQFGGGGQDHPTGCAPLFHLIESAHKVAWQKYIPAQIRQRILTFIHS